MKDVIWSKLMKKTFTFWAQNWPYKAHTWAMKYCLRIRAPKIVRFRCQPIGDKKEWNRRSLLLWPKLSLNWPFEDKPNLTALGHHHLLGIRICKIGKTHAHWTVFPICVPNLPIDHKKGTTQLFWTHRSLKVVSKSQKHPLEGKKVKQKGLVSQGNPQNNHINSKNSHTTITLIFRYILNFNVKYDSKFLSRGNG